MAKKSQVMKNLKRQQFVERFSKKRAELLLVIKDPNASIEDKRNAYSKIEKMPKDSNPIRVRNRCNLTGRPRGFYRKFGLSRIALRELASQGKIPGVKKASW